MYKRLLRKAQKELRQAGYDMSWKRDSEVLDKIDRMLGVGYDVDVVVDKIAFLWGDHTMQMEDHPIWDYVQTLADEMEDRARNW